MKQAAVAPENKLQEVMGDNQDFVRLARALTRQKRSSFASDLWQLQHKFRNSDDMARLGLSDLDRATLLNFFDRLARAGIGTLLPSVDGKPAKFIWNYTCQSVGQSILHPGKEPLEPLASAAARGVSGIIMPAPTLRNSRGGMVLGGTTRSGVTFQLRLPQDATAEDMAAVGKEIQEVINFNLS